MPDRPDPLRARDVGFTYPAADRPALDGVDLEVRAGECLALLGPNGAGKTTLIRTITGLATPDTGMVRVAGDDPRQASTRRRIGVMLQSTAFPSHLTVRELVEGAAFRSGRTARDVDDVLAEVGMADLAGRRSKALSGGQRRRLQLARSLVVDPALLVLDEPTEGLDGESRRATWGHLAARRDAGMAILLTTHLVAEAGEVADRVAVITAGRIVADASPEVLTDRLPDRTIHLTTDVDVDRVRSRPEVDHVTTTATGPGARSTLAVTTRHPEDILRWLLAADRDADDLRVVGASLEDAVLAITADRPERIDSATAPDDPTTATTAHHPGERTLA